MNDERAKAALASLAGPLVMSKPEAQERQSDQVLPRLRQLVREVPARRRKKVLRRRAATAGGVIVACSLALGVWVGLARNAAPFQVEAGPAASHRDERHGYATGAGALATLRTRQGAHVSLSESTRLSAVSSEPKHELLHLAAGSIQVRVPKLGAGATFTVQTPDSVITVHGTVFSVTVLGAGPSSETCVAVSEGLVGVEHAGRHKMVGAGHQDNCPAEVSKPTPTAVEPFSAVGTQSKDPSPTPSSERHAAARPGASAPPLGRRSDESLAAQNRLMATALQAERAGKFAEARSQLQELLARYPVSPLRADAERSLARVSRKIP